MKKVIDDFIESAERQGEVVVCVCTDGENAHSFTRGGGQSTENIVGVFHGCIKQNPALEMIVLNAVVSLLASDKQRMEKFSKALGMAMVMNERRDIAPDVKLRGDV